MWSGSQRISVTARWWHTSLFLARAAAAGRPRTRASTRPGSPVPNRASRSAALPPAPERRSRARSSRALASARVGRRADRVTWFVWLGGLLGSTVLTQPRGFSIKSGGNIDFLGGGGAFSAGDEEQGWTATSTTLGENTTQSVVPDLPAQSERAEWRQGGASVAAVLLRAFANTNTSYTGTAAIEITNATVDEYDEPASTGTTPVGAPPYSQPTALIDTSLSPALTGGYGCQTVTPSSPQPSWPAGTCALRHGQLPQRRIPATGPQRLPVFQRAALFRRLDDHVYALIKSGRSCLWRWHGTL